MVPSNHKRFTKLPISQVCIYLLSHFWLTEVSSPQPYENVKVLNNELRKEVSVSCDNSVTTYSFEINVGKIWVKALIYFPVGWLCVDNKNYVLIIKKCIYTHVFYEILPTPTAHVYFAVVLPFSLFLYTICKRLDRNQNL